MFVSFMLPPTPELACCGESPRSLESGVMAAEKLLSTTAFVASSEIEPEPEY